MIRALYSQVATPQHLEPLGLVELPDRTNKVLNRVVKQEFFQRFSESHAVQYFYFRNELIKRYSKIINQILWYKIIYVRK